MKTIHEYEPQDIRTAGFAEGETMDPVYSFLIGQMLVIALTGFKKQPGDPEDAMWPVKRLIANFLNDAHR